MTDPPAAEAPARSPAPKVSVILPVYNGQETLRECLDSKIKII